MADTSDLRNGLIIRFKHDLYSVTDFLHVKPGKGGAFVRTTLKSLTTGRVLENTFRSGESLDVVKVERRKFQYLYADGESLVCMDNETYDQINVPLTAFGDSVKFLKEGTDVDMLMDGEKIVSVETPVHAVLKVLETEPGFKGDTATNAVKPAKLETGATVMVPLFINEGDLLKIDTRSGDYMERVKS
ncbi:MAG: elongation factor P [Ignavibacteriales bacterium]|jgi:translation elongation factor P (EF-P)|nr:MAG: elongation factor P [Ignavibacteriaceae bacterium]MBW7873286.1 elongation factor P [Ignavibacteria bacterium]MCZ2143024.1 elongation factor P [Ignavibacteriales bacterium]OQY77471.1 MAG: elongation factor P [Ignavibacteriales bacterium UTCHB3]MBV6444714.1 Elongation factor P [Ignavibacteriaceae bacterium]